MPRWTRNRIAGLSLLALTGLVALCAWVLLATTLGLELVWARTAARLPEGVSVSRIGGRLLGPIELAGVRVRSDGADVAVEQVRLEWRARSLLRRTVEVDALEVTGVRIVTPAPAGEDHGGPGPSVESLQALRLPVRLDVRRLSIVDLRFARGAAGEPLGLVTLDLRDVSFQDTLIIGAMAAVAGQGRVHAGGWIAPRGSYPLRVEVAWDLTLDEVGALEGSATVSGDLAGLAADVTTERPLVTRITGSVHDPLGRRALDVRADVEETALRSVRQDWPEGSVAGWLHAVGVLDSLRVDVDARGDSPHTGPATVRAELELVDDRIVVERMDVRAGDGRLRAEGSVALAGEPRPLDIAANWSALRWPLVGDPEMRTAAGNLRARGTLGDYTVEGAATLARVGGPEGRVVLEAHGSREALTLQRLEARALGMSADLTGRVSWAPRQSWALRGTVRDVDPAALSDDARAWPGTLSLSGSSQGWRAESGIRANILLSDVRGPLRSAPVAGSLEATVHVPASDGRLELPDVDATVRGLDVLWGENRLSARGVVSDTLDVDFTLEVPDAALLDETLSGALAAQGRLAGPRASPRARASVSARDLAREGARVGRLDVDALVDTGPGGIVYLDGVAADVALDGRFVDSIRVAADGTTGSHRLEAQVAAPEGTLALRARGGVEGGAWTGIVETLDAALERWGAWRLGAPFAVALTPDSAVFEQGCWVEAPATLCASGTWRRDGPHLAALELEGLALDRYGSLLPPGWYVSGAANARADVHVEPDLTLEGVLALDLGSGSLAYPSGSGPSSGSSSGSRSLRYSDARLDAAIDEGGLRADLGAVVVDEDGAELLTAEGELALLELTGLAGLTDAWAAEPVSGRMRALVTDFSMVEAASPAITSLSGAFTADIAIDGTVGRPELLGEARFSGGVLEVEQLGLAAREIELVARGRGLEGLSIEGTLRSGDGTLRLTGDVPVALDGGVPARMRIVGQDVHALGLPQVSAWISPNLEAVVTPGSAEVTGEILVPRARVELTELAPNAVRPSRDVVFTDDSLASARQLMRIIPRVRVTLGDSISVQGFGFTARPRGTLLLSEGPGATLVGTGEVTVTGGRYRAYGQDLTIERGRILFASSPLDDPGLDVRASRTAGDGVVAGLDVSGTLGQPEVAVFSEPAMPQSDALAYIVLGRPLGAASTAEGNRVASAAASLGLRRGDVLAGRIAQRFGLSDARIEADGPLDQAALVAGKYLSPRLYVSYGVGLIEPVSTFRMRYLLSGRWTLTAESGSSAGADLLYRIERGRQR